MHENSSMLELQVGPQGRVVIPASLRRVWPLQTGETLVAYLQDDRLVLEKPSAIAQRAQGRFRALQGKASLADELIADRRREVAADEAR